MTDRKPLDPRRIDAQLQTTDGAWEPVRVFSTVDSTQDALRRDLDAAPLRDPQTWRLAIADAQSAGRGRTGARWAAPERSALLLTVGGALQVPPERWPRASLVAGLAVAEALARCTGIDVWLKWPNDLLIRAPDRSFRKLGGLLCERVEAPGGLPAWLCGVGVNVAAPLPGEWPEIVQASAASLEQAGATRLDREDLAAAVAQAIRNEVLAFAHRGGELDVQRLEARLAFRGLPVELDLGPQEGLVWAVLDGLAPNGMPRVRRLRPDGSAGPAAEVAPITVTAARSSPPWRAAPRL